MKKLLTVLGLAILVWGCTKKMAPAKSETPSTNTGAGATSNNSNSNMGSSNTGNATTTTSAPVVTGNTGQTGTKTAAMGTMSPQDMAIRDGQNTYNMKCNKCHQLHVTTNFTELRWVQVMQVMARNANLTETEKSNVLAYVRANAKK